MDRLSSTAATVGTRTGTGSGAKSKFRLRSLARCRSDDFFDFFAISAPQRRATPSVPLLWLGRHHLDHKCVVTTSCLSFCSSRVTLAGHRDPEGKESARAFVEGANSHACCRVRPAYFCSPKLPRLCRSLSDVADGRVGASHLSLPAGHGTHSRPAGPYAPWPRSVAAGAG